MALIETRLDQAPQGKKTHTMLWIQRYTDTPKDGSTIAQPAPLETSKQLKKKFSFSKAAKLT